MSIQTKIPGAPSQDGVDQAAATIASIPVDPAFRAIEPFLRSKDEVRQATQSLEDFFRTMTEAQDPEDAGDRAPESPVHTSAAIPASAVVNEALHPDAQPHSDGESAPVIAMVPDLEEMARGVGDDVIPDEDLADRLLRQTDLDHGDDVVIVAGPFPEEEVGETGPQVEPVFDPGTGEDAQALRDPHGVEDPRLSTDPSPSMADLDVERLDAESILGNAVASGMALAIPDLQEDRDDLIGMDDVDGSRATLDLSAAALEGASTDPEDVLVDRLVSQLERSAAPGHDPQDDLAEHAEVETGGMESGADLPRPMPAGYSDFDEMGYGVDAEDGTGAAVDLAEPAWSEAQDDLPAAPVDPWAAFDESMSRMQAHPRDSGLAVAPPVLPVVKSITPEKEIPVQMTRAKSPPAVAAAAPVDTLSPPASLPVAEVAEHAWMDEADAQGEPDALSDQDPVDTETSRQPEEPVTKRKSSLAFALVAASLVGVMGVGAYPLVAPFFQASSPMPVLAVGLVEAPQPGQPMEEQAAQGIPGLPLATPAADPGAVPGIALQGTLTEPDLSLADLFLDADAPVTPAALPAPVQAAEPAVAVVTIPEFEILSESVRTIDENSRDLEAALRAQDERLAQVEAALMAALERAERAESIAVAQNQILTRFVAAEEKLEIAEQLIVDLSRRVASVEGNDPADRGETDARMTRLDEQIRGLQRDIGMVARMAINGSPAAVSGRAPSGQANFDTATQASLRSPVARTENVPRDVAVGDFVNGFGVVLEIFQTSDGGRMVVMENGSVVLN